MPMIQQTEWSDRHPAKAQLRAEIWSRLREQKASRRDPTGHIPNFLGAEQAAERLAQLPIWQQAEVIKCNPDSPQKWVRLRALQEGKRLYMAVPRLIHKRCFVELTAADLQTKGVTLEDAATMRNALIHGQLVSFAEMRSLDLIVVGCVAVTREGGRTGKGAGFADLELAMLQMFNLVDPQTPIITTIHPLQLVETTQLPMQLHDWALDWLITPDAVLQTHTSHPRPTGLNWDDIQPDQYQKIPILRKLRDEVFSHPTS